MTLRPLSSMIWEKTQCLFGSSSSLPLLSPKSPSSTCLSPSWEIRMPRLLRLESSLPLSRKSRSWLTISLLLMTTKRRTSTWLSASLKTKKVENGKARFQPSRLPSLRLSRICRQASTRGLPLSPMRCLPLPLESLVSETDSPRLPVTALSLVPNLDKSRN